MLRRVARLPILSNSATGSVNVTTSTTAANTNVALRLAFLVSTLGDWIYRLAVPTLVLQITGSAVSTAIAYTLEFVPYIVIGLVSGVAADRVNRRRLLIWCDTVSALLALAVAGIAQMAHPSVGALYVCAFLLACVRPFYFPAFQGLIVDIVPERRLAALNSWTQVVDSVLGFVGPALATLVIAGTGASLAAVVNAVSFGVSAVFIFRIMYEPAHEPHDRAKKVVAGLLEDFAVGLRLLWRLRPVLAGTFLMALANLAAFTVEGSLFYLVLHVQQLPTLALGIVFSAQGLGAVAGSVVAPKMIARYRTGLLLSWGMGLSGLAMLIPVAAPTWTGVVVGWGIEGIATSMIVVCWFTARQKLVPSANIGRIVAVGRAIAYTTIPIGTVLGGLLVTAAGATRLLFLVAATVQVGVFVGCLVSSLRLVDTRSINRTPQQAEL